MDTPRARSTDANDCDSKHTATAHQRMDPQTAAVYDSVLRRMGIDGRARLAMQLSVMARRLSEDGIRIRHPEYDDRQVTLAAIKLAIGAKLFSAAYPGEDIEP
jgi:hypothetical protein